MYIIVRYVFILIKKKNYAIREEFKRNDLYERCKINMDDKVDIEKRREKIVKCF